MSGFVETRLEEVARLVAPHFYTAEGFLGRGGMAEVFLIRHDFLGKLFALKVIHRRYVELPGFVSRMELEARVLGKLISPHIVEIIDLWFEEDGTPLLVLEYLKGRSLKQELEASGTLSVPMALCWARQALSALSVAHERGLIHRDIKPANLFLHDAAGYGRSLKVLDFGLTRVETSALEMHPGMPSVRTTTGSLVGSPNYMSPEALRAETLDARTDVYGVGLVLYEMLTGRGPFDFADTLQPMKAVRSDLPHGLDAIVEKALHEEPDQRYSNVRSFYDDLSQIRAR